MYLHVHQIIETKEQTMCANVVDSPPNEDQGTYGLEIYHRVQRDPSNTWSAVSGVHPQNL
jgi:hypothetical protein